MKKEKQDRCFDVVGIKYINLDNVKSIIFTKLEPGTNQRRTQVIHKIDSGVNANLIPFKIFESLQCILLTLSIFML